MAHPAQKPEQHAAHEPEGGPSYWPAILGGGAVLLVVGFLLIFMGVSFLGAMLGIVGFIVVLMGWVASDIARERHVKSPEFFQPPKRQDIRFIVGVFLMTESALFSGAFAVFFLTKFRYAEWPPPGSFELNIPFTLVNTIILVASGFTMHLAKTMLARENQTGFKWLLVLTLILGGIFLAGQFSEYFEILAEWEPSFVVFGSIFFALTGLHGLHVMTGLGFILIVLVRAQLGVKVPLALATSLGLKGGRWHVADGGRGYVKMPRFSRHRHDAVEACSWFWHFVDLVWIVLFAVVYLNFP